MDARHYWPPLYIRLPELQRDGRRVVRQAGVHQFRLGAPGFGVQYMERGGIVSDPFRVVCFQTVDGSDITDCILWADSCGR